MAQEGVAPASRKSHPARLTMEETGWALGFSAHEIPVLISRGLLKPLGHPVPNTMKWFAAVSVEELRQDVKWLSRATDAMMEYWRGKNARKTGAGELASGQGRVSDRGFERLKALESP